MKTLTCIKKVLQSYAFARPHVRLSLKVLKSKNEKQNWIYGPKPDASIKDVATRVGGQELASQCVLETLANTQATSNCAATSPDAAENDSLSSFHVVALLPRPDSGACSTLSIVVA